jgi:hypothetical protein
MDNKQLVAGFLMCIMVIAAFSLHEAKAAQDDKFKLCFTNCKEGCTKDGNGNSFCEMKCDNECGAKELAGN